MKPQRNRVSIVVLHKKKILGFHAQDPYNKKAYFFLPGGKIESGESAKEAAIREAFEETGYRIKVIDGTKVTRRYDFEWDGVVNDCTTQFMAGQLIDEKPMPVSDAPYHQGVAWVSVSDIESVFGYHKDILESIQQIIAVF